MGSMCPLSLEVLLASVRGLVVLVGVGGVGGTWRCRHSRLLRTAAVHTEIRFMIKTYIVNPYFANIYMKMLFCLFDLILYVPVNNLSVISGPVFLG